MVDTDIFRPVWFPQVVVTAKFFKFSDDSTVDEIVEMVEYNWMLEKQKREVELRSRTVQFIDDSNVECIIEKAKHCEGKVSENEIEDESDKEEEEFQKKDAIRKFQFDYNRSVCLVDKYPEAGVTEEYNNERETISFAPGEGKYPENILSSKNWDVQAFPMKHPDGRNGLHEDRDRKLTDQYYFVQRLRNNDTRFSKDPGYVFAAAQYLEKKQLQRNVNVSYLRGKEVKDNSGTSTFMLEDGFSVFGNISNTPRYWKTAKHEMLAKLDNLGPFHFFFTLSCADRRWEENFSSILRKRTDVEIVYTSDKFGNDKTIVRNIKTQNEIGLKEFLEKEENQSEHEMIRKNIFIATRNYYNRVKAFIHDIIEDKNNPMCVEHWTTKVEFQGRGAAHNHGTIWVDTKKMELTFIDSDGRWKPLHNLIKSKLEKHETEKELRRLLTKYFVDRDIFNEADSESLYEISRKFLPSEHDNVHTDKFINRFCLFGLSAAFKKFQSKEDLLEHEERAVITFADRFTTCTLNKHSLASRTDDKTLKERTADVIDIVTKVNLHKHTKSCRKYASVCRFRFPKFPMWRTILSKPLPALGEEGKQRKEKYDNVLKIVMTVMKDEELINSILEDYPLTNDNSLELYRENRKKRIIKMLNLAGLKTESDINLYEEALSWNTQGYTIVLERDINEMYINSYNPEWVRAWDGNTDIQPCFDYFSVITYITEYFTKDDTGMIAKLVEMLKDSDCQSLQEKMILVMNTFITARQMSECEAFFKILPNLQLKDSNVTTVFVPTSRRELRSKFMIKIDENETYHGREKKKIGGRDGWFVEKYDLIDKYMRLDKKCKEIKLLVLSQFFKMFETAHKVKNQKEEKEEHQSESDTDDDECVEDENTIVYTHKFDYVMTAKKGNLIPLPDYIEIDNPYPGEPQFMRKRSKPAVLRFHKLKQDTNPADYFFAEALLYTPFKTEEELQKRVDEASLDGYKELAEEIQAVKSQVMEHLESNEEARHMAEEAINKNKEMGEELDPEGEQEMEDCNREGILLHPEFEHLNLDDVDVIGPLRHEKTFRPIEVDNFARLCERTREMDFYQRKALQEGIKYARLVVKARQAKNGKVEGWSVIVHGGAGSGKSSVINIMKQWCHLILQQPGDDPDCPYILVAGPTGTAAANIQGQTMHTAFGFSFGNEFFSLSDKVRDKKRSLLRNLKIIIIDEISMVKSDQIFQLDKRLREVTQRTNRVYGGIFIFYFGDMMQLKPCLGRYAFEEPINPDYKVEYQLGLHWKNSKVIILETNHRQGEDGIYADMLNRFRVGQQSRGDMEKLQSRVRPLSHPDLKGATFISCTNKSVEKLNKLRLNELKEEKVTIEAINIHPTIQSFKPPIGKKGTVKDTPFLQSLELKIGAKVQLTYNIDTLDCLTNGTRGVVADYVRNNTGQIEKIMVKFQEAHQGKQKRDSQPHLNSAFPGCTAIERVMFQYSLAKKSKNVANTAKVIQFPLSLCFAATSHRFQGQTVYKPNKVACDFNTIFQAAQGYVMLSRVQTLQQLFIIDSLPLDKFYAAPQALTELERLESVSVNRNPPTWEQDHKWSYKLIVLNCRSLHKHLVEMKNDPIIAFSDIVCLSETWLGNNEVTEDLKFPQYDLHLNSMGEGKGIATYFKANKVTPTTDICKSMAQITCLSSQELDIVHVYRSQGMKKEELAEDLRTCINSSRLTIICGDFNICFVSDRDNVVTRMLEGMGFSQLVNEATHFKGGHIDHVYSNHNPAKHSVDISLYSPYYLCLDHDAICITVVKASGHSKSSK